jgi:Arc/MetJ-type ribon-helix-helix transcriptional regulator
MRAPMNATASSSGVDTTLCDAEDGLVNRIDKVGTMSRAALLDLVAQLRYIAPMKTATIPSVRVEPEFRAELESVLAEGESLSEFVEASVRASVERRRVQAEFVARGLRSRDEAKRTGDYVDADDVVTALQRKLDAARTRLAKPPTTRQ